MLMGGANVSFAYHDGMTCAVFVDGEGRYVRWVPEPVHRARVPRFEDVHVHTLPRKKRRKVSDQERVLLGGGVRGVGKGVTFCGGVGGCVTVGGVWWLTMVTWRIHAF